ncbi:hypothetical protein E2C01_004347 [Portunus trituberculatus]|uniref:Uncharacterized protein n=1 Tax=Portunus trituberculatus TaxID=210409 RepID=A0A5B7CR56_PORTR|nr:hypothetical protein [Portunus trituberculatus]
MNWPEGMTFESQVQVVLLVCKEDTVSPAFLIESIDLKIVETVDGVKIVASNSAPYGPAGRGTVSTGGPGVLLGPPWYTGHRNWPVSASGSLGSAASGSSSRVSREGQPLSASDLGRLLDPLLREAGAGG